MNWYARFQNAWARIIIVYIKWNGSHREALELRIVEVHWCSQTAVNASTAGKVLTITITIASQCGSLWAIELHIELSRAIGFLFFFGSLFIFFCACVLLASMARLILLQDSSCISHSSSAVRRQRSCARWRRNIVCANLRIVCLSSSY